MANFNNYGGYNGFSYPYGMPYQPVMPQAQQPNYNNMGNMMNNQNQQQAQTTQCNFVNGIEGAKAFQMIPNQTVMLMDSENPMLYMKTSNGMGQSTLKYYKLVETNEQEIRNQNVVQPQQTQPSEEYALKSDLDVLSKKIDEISKRFEKPFKNEKNVEKGGNQ